MERIEDPRLREHVTFEDLSKFKKSVLNGRTDVETEVPILWPPDAKNWLIGKDPDTCPQRLRARGEEGDRG